MSKLQDQLKRHEGYRKHPYRCSADKLTIGYGFNLDDVGVDRALAEYILARDIARASRELSSRHPFVSETCSPRRDVLVNMVFNLGINRFSKFKRMLGAYRHGDYDRASEEMLDSKWARQVGPRAIELSEQMRTGKYQDEV